MPLKVSKQHLTLTFACQSQLPHRKLTGRQDVRRNLPAYREPRRVPRVALGLLTIGLLRAHLVAPGLDPAAAFLPCSTGWRRPSRRRIITTAATT